MAPFKQFLYIAAALTLIASCNKKQATVEEQSELIEITNKQFQTESMALGTIEKQTFENVVKCNGVITPLPNGMANVCVPISGTIQSIHCNNGQLVKKNDVLVEISGNELIDLQKDYAEISAQIKRLKSEYSRAKALYDEKVGSEKDFIIAESEYFATNAKYNGLKIKIETIGLSSSRIEKGEFYTSYPIKSPIHGYISELKVTLGTFADPLSTLLEIIDPSKFQLKLSVFSNDIITLSKGQVVRFGPLSGNAIYMATLSSIGSSINPQSKAIDCYAAITADNFSNPVNNAFVKSEIVTSTDSFYAVPSEAVLKSENEYFLLELDKKDSNIYFFKKIPVKIGRQNNGYTEILNYDIPKKILFKGTYNISI